MKRFLEKRPGYRICVGVILILGGVIWLFTPIPGSGTAFISGLYLINEKWAKKKIAQFRKKFPKK